MLGSSSLHVNRPLEGYADILPSLGHNKRFQYGTKEISIDFPKRVIVFLRDKLTEFEKLVCTNRLQMRKTTFSLLWSVLAKCNKLHLLS